ncbi:DUF4870 domain-containing protein [Ruicaihuangia caeni]|uniref:DUF4870 domain-containing protein n=1 Tax=Ruicaihuangia caeni TaxID=3042517 RepID=A0AAW6T752_9MICO|nr:DUF4870 domain-containing protein [Klugiella sp. YN-L-19]MDI2097930.1 DUF4870 domain-containing protein [Klugiella sp. YN-L-19]
MTNEFQQPQPLSPADEKLWATLVHLGGIFFGFVPALIGYLVLRDRGPFVREHTRQALNFQISLAIYAAGLFVLTLITLGIGGLLFIPFGIAALVLMVIAAVAANKGEWYKYPLTIEFIKQ